MGLNEDNMSRFAKLQLFIFRNNRTTVELGKYTELQRVCNGFLTRHHHTITKFIFYFIVLQSVYYQIRSFPQHQLTTIVVLVL